MKRVAILFLVLFLLLTVIAGCSGTANTSATTVQTTTQTGSTAATTAPTSKYDKLTEITFGICGQMTGANALSGEYITRGATLAMEEINAAGGVLGKKIKLVFGDEGGDQQTAINAAQKVLTTENLSGFFGGFTSSYAVAMLPYVTEAKVPFMAAGSSANIAKAKNEWTWQPRLVDVYSSAALAKAAVNVMNMKKPAILYVNESFGISNYEGIIATLKTLNVTPAIALSYNAGETQFSNMLTQIIQSGADGLIGITTQPIDAATIMSQTAKMNFPLPCLGSNGFATTTARQTVKKDSNGWKCITDYSSTNTHETGIAFEKAYKARWGTMGDLAAVVAYDSVKLLALAAKNAGSSDPAAINKALAGIKDYKGAMADMSIDTEYHCFAQWLVLVVNENDGSLCRVIDTIKK